MRQQKTKDIVIALAPFSGAAETLFLITMQERQWKDAQSHVSYATELLKVIKGRMSECAKVTADMFDIELWSDEYIPEARMRTIEIADGWLRLH